MLDTLTVPSPSKYALRPLEVTVAMLPSVGTSTPAKITWISFTPGILINDISRSLVKVNGLISNVTSCTPSAVVVDITNCSIT